ncbi:MAG: TPM domain-containing protein, partial [Firmicutes bacterium]|nr:TPM domain-containing protein [Bacillota bacterium]
MRDWLSPFPSRLLLVRPKHRPGGGIARFLPFPSRLQLTLALLFLFTLLSRPLLAADPVLPGYKGYINDFAGLLSTQERAQMENLVRQVEAKTSAELAVAIVKTTQPLDPKMYAVKLLEKWGVGKKGKDNGVLFLLALDERRIEVEVGYGLEGILPDGKVGEILDRHVIPYFKSQQYGRGLYEGLLAVAKVIDPQFQPGEKAGTPSGPFGTQPAPRLSSGGVNWIIRNRP